MERHEWAVVVGATGAMGQLIVRQLASAGLLVLAVARDVESLASLVASEDGVFACATDIADDSSIEAMAARLNAPVRMVVHGPGVPASGGVLRAQPRALSEAVNVKVGGMLRLVRAVDAHLVRGSRLVAIGGHYGFEPSAYAASPGVANAALANLVRQLSWAYGPRGVTSHLVAPGPADTDRLRRVAAERAAIAGQEMETVLNEMRSESAIDAFTTPEQIAWAVRTLLAPEADALAGSTLFMDAGRRKGMP